MSTDIDGAINLFFRNPEEEPVDLGTLGVLYLLRRDILRCLQNDGAILFPALMLICAGIDLLAKFYAGNDDGNVGQRYKDYTIKYFSGISTRDAEVLYQLRNALLHSFGLYSRDRQGNEYNFRIGPATQLVALHNGSYYVSIQLLFLEFEHSIARYRNDLASDSTLRTKFQRMFPWYGTTGLSLS